MSQQYAADKKMPRYYKAEPLPLITYIMYGVRIPKRNDVHAATGLSANLRNITIRFMH